VATNDEMHERIYDVAVSDKRKNGDDGRCREEVGTSIDIKKATYSNSIGDAQSSAHWRDPDFDSNEHAFYYVRLIEIPTPQWTADDAVRFGIEMPEEITMTIQERAYTSPIWYTP
jgi:hypothetical protein